MEDRPRPGRLLFRIAIAVLLVAITVAYIVVQFMGRAAYRPGDAAKLVAAAAAPAGPADSTAFRVSPGISLHRRSLGRGPDALVLHGGPGVPTPEPWRAARLLGERLTLHFYDQRGCGRSTRPIDRMPGDDLWREMKAVEAELGLAQQVADIERIRRVLGCERLVLFGHSFGALLAGLYAAEFPDRVSALVLVSPAPLVRLPHPGEDLFLLIERDLPDSARASYDAWRREYFDFPRLFTRDERALSLLFGRFRHFWALAMAERARRAGRADSTGAWEAGLARGDSMDVGGWMTLGVYTSMGNRHDWRPAFRRIAAPTLVVHGADDLQPLTDSEGFAPLIPGSRLVTLAGATHFAFDETPVAFADSVRAFLDGLR